MSKRMWITAAAGPLALVALAALHGEARSQTGTSAATQAPPAPSGLTRVPPVASGPAQRPGGGDFDAGTWSARLTLEDLSQRELQFDALVELARGDAAALLWLRSQASASNEDLELAWTCRLALREVLAAQRNAGGGDPHDLPETMGPRGPGGFGVFGPGSFGFPSGPVDVQQQLEELQQQMQQMFGSGGSMLGPRSSIQGSPGGQSHSSSVRVQSGPDGTTVEVTEMVDGEQRVQTYTGESLEQVLKEHPELEATVGQVRFGGGVPFPGGPLQWGLGGRHSSQQPVTRTDVLGVVVRELSEAQAAARGLPPEALLFVERVEPGTIASVIGLGPGDTLLELNGSPVMMIEDIRSALELRPATGELNVVWIDGFGRRQERLWTPTER